MGLFDKLFGGDKKPEPTAAPSSTSSQSTPAPSTGSDGSAPVARRERSKPGAISAAPPSTENADLLAAMTAVGASDNPETRKQLYGVLLTSELFLISMTGPDDEVLERGEVTIQEGQQISLASINSPDGKQYLPAYTDTARLSSALPPGDNARYIRINTAAICRMFMQGTGEGIVLNPGQPPTGIITRAEAQILATGVVPELDEHGQVVAPPPPGYKMTFGKLETKPAQTFIDAILAEAPKHPIVREVHLFKAGMEDQPLRLMIALLVESNLTPEQLHPSFVAIGQAAHDARGDTEAFDMMPLNDQMAEAIKTLESRIYQREGTGQTDSNGETLV